MQIPKKMLHGRRILTRKLSYTVGVYLLENVLARSAYTYSKTLLHGRRILEQKFGCTRLLA